MTKQNRAIGAVWIILGGLLFVAALAAVVVYAATNLLVALMAIFVAYGAMRVLNRGRRHFVAIGLDTLDADPRPPVLYLRPFHSDGIDFQIDPGTIGRSFGERGFWRQVGVLVRLIRTNEQLFARAFRRMGPLVAIGDPEEGLPRLGAVRVYARQGDEWKRVVADLAARSSTVILEIGLSEGVMWEVDFVTDTVAPEQLVLSIPNDRKGATRLMRSGTRERRRQEQYQAFRHATVGEFSVPLPEQIGRSKLMYFGPDWTPQPTFYEREIMFPFGRRIRHPGDPKLEALIWCNSILF